MSINDEENALIIVRVELQSAITGQVTELARAHIANVGGTHASGNYFCETLRGRNRDALDKNIRQRSGSVKDYPRLAIHVWHLVARALVAMGYAGKNEQQVPSDIDAPEHVA
jgi:hypothetical protein